MSGPVVHPYAKGIVCIWFDKGIKKRDSPSLLIIFNSELNACMGLLLDDPGVTHKAVQVPRG